MASIVYFVPDMRLLPEGVVTSQVFEYAKLLRDQGRIVSVICSSSSSGTLSAVGLTVVALDAFGMLRALRAVPPDTIFYTRSIIAYFIARVLRGGLESRICFDARAMIGAEVRLRRGDGFVSRIISRLEHRAWKDATTVMAVSRTLAYAIRSVSHRKAEVVPPICNISTFQYTAGAKQRSRVALGIQEDIALFCYVGGADVWQALDHMALFVRKALQEHADLGLLVVSRDSDRILGRLVEHNIPAERIFMRSGGGNVVANCIHASDYGLLPREMSPVNQVAFPIKAIEYAVGGLPIISSGVVHALDDLARAGSIIVLEEDLKMLLDVGVSDTDRVRSSDLVKRWLAQQDIRRGQVLE